MKNYLTVLWRASSDRPWNLYDGILLETLEEAEAVMIIQSRRTPEFMHCIATVMIPGSEEK